LRLAVSQAVYSSITENRGPNVADENEDGLTNSTTAAAPRSGAPAVTLSKAIELVLLPLAALNYACATAKTYFEQRFAAEHTIFHVWISLNR
jgi:hypothetical protein